MCGICGFIDFSLQSRRDDLTAIAQRMAATVRHRGPDEGNDWVDAEAGIALAHRRLSILDLTPTGHQPMVSRSGRYVISFNGEIYNFRELRKSLSRCGAVFEGRSDTEVILGAIEAWGLREALERANGMFGFAVWDTRERVLHIARDRLGEKPLYYGWFNSCFVFGSELKALRKHPQFHAAIDRRSLALYMRHGYVPAPYTIYEGVAKLLPGSYLTISREALGERPTPIRYWTMPVPAQREQRHGESQTEKDQLDELDALLRDAVRIRMIADVPLGAFLSGGVDSSLIVALMQAESSVPVRTFTIGFEEDRYNEAHHAKLIAEHLSTEHTELYVGAQQALDVVPRLPSIYDEPFGDSSQIPTCLLAALTRTYVTVALSGDGGDEVFAGYRRYSVAARIWKARSQIPRPVRAGIRRYLQLRKRVQPSLPWQAISTTVLSHRLKSRLRHIAELLSVNDPHELYTKLTSHWLAADVLAPAAVPHPTVATALGELSGDVNAVRGMMYLDTLMYLPDDILVKVDRATMSASLEARIPFLDHRLVEYAWTKPLSRDFTERSRKAELRQLLSRYVPAYLFERPKMGFAAPIDAWLRGVLRDWAECLLDPKRLAEDGYFNADFIRARWNAHLAGIPNYRDSLWIVLMFQAWLDATR